MLKKKKINKQIYDVSQITQTKNHGEEFSKLRKMFYSLNIKYIKYKNKHNTKSFEKKKKVNKCTKQYYVCKLFEILFLFCYSIYNLIVFIHCEKYPF